MNDPERTAERLGRLARSTGNVDMQMGLLSRADGQAGRQAGMDLTRERDASGRAHDMTMFDMHQQARQASEAQSRQQHLDDWTRNQGAQQQRDEAGRTHDMTMFGLNQGQRAMEQEREQKLREQERTRTPQVGTIQVPGTDYVIPTADGRAMGTLPVRPAGPLPAGLVPMQAERNGVQYGTPKAGKPVVPTVKEFKSENGTKTEYREYNPDTGKWRKVQYEDANRDGVVTPEEAAAAKAGAVAGSPVRAPSGFLGRF